jgi:AcrR family transcriptional regulator
MAGVADRAGVSTATLYRRWASKEELVVGTVAHLAPDRPDIDTGSLAGDLAGLLEQLADRLAGEGGRVLRGLIGEIAWNPPLADALRLQALVPRLEELGRVFDRAVQRGEIPPPREPAVAIGLVLGPLHYRFLMTGEPVDRDFVHQLVPVLLTALGSTE